MTSIFWLSLKKYKIEAKVLDTKIVNRDNYKNYGNENR